MGNTHNTLNSYYYKHFLVINYPYVFNSYLFNRVKQLKCLGTILTEHNEISKVAARIQTGNNKNNKCYYVIIISNDIKFAIIF